MMAQSPAMERKGRTQCRPPDLQPKGTSPAGKFDTTRGPWAAGRESANPFRFSVRLRPESSAGALSQATRQRIAFPAESRRAGRGKPNRAKP